MRAADDFGLIGERVKALAKGCTCAVKTDLEGNVEFFTTDAHCPFHGEEPVRPTDDVTYG